MGHIGSVFKSVWCNGCRQRHLASQVFKYRGKDFCSSCYMGRAYANPEFMPTPRVMISDDSDVARRRQEAMAKYVFMGKV